MNSKQRKMDIREKVFFGKLRLSEINTIDLVSDFHALKKARKGYLRLIAEPPENRYSFFVTGDRSTHSFLAIKERAKEFIDSEGKMLDRDIFFEACVSNKGCFNFRDYDGQPIIIWHYIDDRSLLKTLDFRSILANFDPHPPNVVVTKSGLKLTNSINILLSHLSVDDFINRLSYSENHDHYKDRGEQLKTNMEHTSQQLNRRFIRIDDNSNR